MVILEQIKALGFFDHYVFFNTLTRKLYSQNAFINTL